MSNPPPPKKRKEKRKKESLYEYFHQKSKCSPRFCPIFTQTVTALLSLFIPLCFFGIFFYLQSNCNSFPHCVARQDFPYSLVRAKFPFCNNPFFTDCVARQVFRWRGPARPVSTSTVWWSSFLYVETSSHSSEDLVRQITWASS